VKHKKSLLSSPVEYAVTAAMLFTVALTICHSVVQAQEPAVAGYDNSTAISARARAIARSDLATYHSLGTTLGGRDLPLITIGRGDVDAKPAVLVVAGVNPERLIDSEIALQLAERLVDGSEGNPDLRRILNRVTFYIIPRCSPDASESFFIAPHAERATNLRPMDDDTDGQVDEDGPEDLNGDGQITMMRVEDPSGRYIPHPNDGRVMIEADATQGELGRFSLYAEGRDNDGDLEVNEDPVGGVIFNRNFTFDYPYFEQGSGPHQVSEVETRAVADFAFTHPNIAIVWTLTEEENLQGAWEIDAPSEGARAKTSLLDEDALYFDAIAESYQELCVDEEVFDSPPGGGSFRDWAYFHYGRWSVASCPWRPAPGVEVNDTEADVEKVEDSASLENEDTEGAIGVDQNQAEEVKEDDAKDERGANDIAAMAWLEEQGISGFVEWEVYEHPDFPNRRVEIGGFKPYVLKNPPIAEVEASAELSWRFLLDLAGRMPSVAIESVETKSLGADVWRITVAIVNEGELPTVSEMGRINDQPQRLQAELILPDGMTLLTGTPRRRLPPLPGGGGFNEQTWLIRMIRSTSKTPTVRVGSPMTGSVSMHIPLNETDDRR
jgi:hypothetical protein